nr:MAG TPA: hypothetical protein [Caudoviricetes sp.]
MNVAARRANIGHASKRNKPTRARNPARCTLPIEYAPLWN